MKAGLPNIEGKFGWVKGTEAPYGSGVFNGTTSRETYAGHTNGTIVNARADFTFDASRSSSVYGNSDTVQPSSMSTIMLVKY